MEPRQSNEPRLYSWDVGAGGPGGVTDDPQRAIEHVNEALRNAPPGTRATVKRVGLVLRLQSHYEDLVEVGRARRDEASGDVTWEV